MELQHLCFEFLEELRPGIIFQRNYSPRATDTPEITVQPCLSLSSGTPKYSLLAEVSASRETKIALTRRKRFKTA